jgi:hypothetical protein
MPPTLPTGDPLACRARRTLRNTETTNTFIGILLSRFENPGAENIALISPSYVRANSTRRDRDKLFT